MQQNVSAGTKHDQQSAPPSYAEAIRAVPPPTNLHYKPNVAGAEESHQYPAVTVPPVPVSSSHSATYTTSAYRKYEPTSTESGIDPTAIGIIKPVTTEPKMGKYVQLLTYIVSFVCAATIVRLIRRYLF